MKLLLTVCYIATTQCQTLPWTGNWHLVGQPVIYADISECNDNGRYLARAHGGHAYPQGHADYDVKGYECVPE
jgi:hypothetical protein